MVMMMVAVVVMVMGQALNERRLRVTNFMEEAGELILEEGGEGPIKVRDSVLVK